MIRCLFCIFHLSSAGIYQVILSWIPAAYQYGPQAFCATAIDNTSIQSNQWCITYVVGFAAPELIAGSASPVGTIFQNQTIFSIQGNIYHRNEKI